jgi:hypothetical protein
VSNQAKIMGELTQTVRFIVERLKSDLVEGNASQDLNLDEDTLRKVIFVVESSVQDSYNRSMDNILNAIG